MEWEKAFRTPAYPRFVACWEDSVLGTGSSLSHGCGVGESGVWWPRGGCSTGLPWSCVYGGESRQASEVGISACVWH